MKRLYTWNISIKLWLAITILILVVLGGLGLTITWLFGDFYFKQKLEALRVEANEISVQLAIMPNWSGRINLLETLKLTSGTQLVLLDPQGNLILMSGSMSSQGEQSIVEWHLGGLVGSPISGRARNLRPSDFFTQEYLEEVLKGKTISIKASPAKGGGVQTMLLSAAPAVSYTHLTLPTILLV